ncbi:hypothetical protein HG530_005893 [Fusarium avenaceum]|nr:hypothetical protein HG530_005893 [Fusarium avenaceum]
MTADCRDDKIVEHCHKIGIVLKVARNMIESQGDLEHLLNNKLLLYSVFLLVFFVCLRYSLNSRNQNVKIFAVALETTKLVEAPCHEDGLGRQGLPEVVIELYRFAVIWTSLPETFHRLQGNTVLNSSVDHIDSLQQFKKAVEVGRRWLCRHAVLLGRCTSAILDPSLAEKSACRFSNVLVPVTNTPSEKLLSHLDRQVTEIT